ncbi:hypothetical protein WKH56_08880 [Priestia sp. SB1]|uniref:Uncharacterized protein n=1 Tax=Priestia aryabhattai TaxID=412384 RepID=A0AAX6NEM5_PRIAR|nr:hypothetical protein [Priestia aryabhattai]MDU9693944.1 hypothetical protein [Priestia aryabhattai]NGY88759.1 hypothetical protein [Priestia megaterium]
MKKHRKKILVPIAIIALLFCYFKFAYVEAEGIKGFPVPREAHLFKSKNDKKEGYTANRYKWSFSYEERGITPFYDMALWLWGWRQGERMGASQNYTKDGRLVDLSAFTKEIDITEYYENSK